MRTKLLIGTFLMLALLASCKSQYEAVLYGSDIQAKYKMAFELFEAKKYSKAAEAFESLTMATRGTAQDDTVQFYWGLSNYMYGDYDTAEANLKNFITNFKGSPFTENATYLRLNCLYDLIYCRNYSVLLRNPQFLHKVEKWKRAEKNQRNVNIQEAKKVVC